ncbi:hypothetical protein [Aureimonas mangrovi]|uniref:hypothetical protein n=1 Tax=Aureimonas mangrovi TaxID=2758041 RepID=UPI00163D5F41|nr:hypothetical protein [Aureimonas mangrovi]
MKAFTTSTILHTLLLTWGLWSFGQPRPLDMTQGESLPVSIVPVEEYSQAMVGEREAEMTDTPAPEPTEAPETLPMPAENVGENEVDLASPPRPETAPRERVQTATSEAPPPPPPPAPEPEPVVEPAPEPEPAPPEPEVAEPAPAPAPEPEPVIDEAAPQVAEAEPEPQEAPAPQNVPLPQVRPVPPVREAERPAETPPTPPREQPAREPERETAESQAQEEPEFDADEIAALLNRESSAGGGAQRSQDQASLGATRNTGERLSQSELDALRGQIQRCWSPPAGVAEAGSLRISIQMSLDPSGQLQGMPQIVSGGGGSSIERIAGEAAVRAVRRCAPYNLPIEKYETWSQVQINFDPSEMF